MNKIKEQLHYRKSTTAAEGSRYRRCKFCTHKTVMEIRGIGGQAMGHGFRCAPVGLENSNKYAIADDHVCDRWEK